MERSRRHLTVPELTCQGCQDLTKELEEVRKINRTMAFENNRLMEERAGAIERDRLQGNEIANLKRQLTAKARKADLSEQIQQVIDHWKEHRPKTRKSSFPEGGKNWQMIDKALKLMDEDEDGPVEACKQAIDGLHLAPFWSYGKRYTKPGAGRDLKNRLEHALGDETRIEKCREIKRAAQNLPLSQKAVMYDATSQTADAWASVYLGALQEKPDDVVEVDGIITAVERGQ